MLAVLEGRGDGLGHLDLARPLLPAERGDGLGEHGRDPAGRAGHGSVVVGHPRTLAAATDHRGARPQGPRPAQPDRPQSGGLVMPTGHGRPGRPDLPSKASGKTGVTMSSTIVGVLRRTARRSGRAAIGIVLAGGLLLAHPAPALAASPIASDIDQQVQMAVTETVFFFADDDDGDPLTFTVLTQPLHGDLTDCSDTSGYCNYTSDPGFTGADSFTYRANRRHHQLQHRHRAPHRRRPERSPGVRHPGHGSPGVSCQRASSRLRPGPGRPHSSASF